MEEFRSNLEHHSASQQLLQGAAIPIYGVRDGNIGACFWLEWRFFLEKLGIKDRVNWCKQEHNRGRLTFLAEEYGLPRFAILRDDSGGHAPKLFSTKAMLAWTLEHFCCAKSAAHGSKGVTREDFATLLDAFRCAAEDAMMSRMSVAERPSLEICGIKLPFDRACYVNIEPILDKLPELPDEWKMLCAHGFALPAWNETATMIPVMSLLKYLGIRLFLAGGRQDKGRRAFRAQGPWFAQELRDALIDVLTYLTEVHLHYSIIDTLARSKGHIVTLQDIFGAGQKRRAHHNSGKKLQLYRAILNSQGSDEVASRAIVRSHGEAASSRHARLWCYEKESRIVFKPAQSIAVGWDGSNHGGPETLCGYMCIPIRNIACYMRPQAGLAYIYVHTYCVSVVFLSYACVFVIT